MEHLSLLALNKLIQDTLKDHLEPSYWLVAEISELRVNQKGHCYLELVQNENGRAVAKSRATIWSYTYRNLSAWFEGITGQPLAEGLKLLANVKVSFHELYGYSLNIQDIDASYTLGEKERQRQEVINRLRQDGVLEMNKEHALPLVPQAIALISSPTAAGYGDFIEHLKNNPYGYRVNAVLFEAIMQGNQAPGSIIKALHQINARGNFDLVALIRGGGSQLDLECFDDYDLCSHLAQFPLPVITGIGHERDDTIADRVAHSKLKTPTAVAEFIIQGMAAFEGALEEAAAQITKTAGFILQNAALHLQSITAGIKAKAQAVVVREEHHRQNFADQLRYRATRQLEAHNTLLQSIDSKHRHLSPESAFRRGFTFTTINGQPVAGKMARKGQKITTYTLKQKLESTITTIEKNEQI